MENCLNAAWLLERCRVAPERLWGGGMHSERDAVIRFVLTEMMDVPL